MHGRFWQSPRFQGDLSWLQTYSRRPGFVTLFIMQLGYMAILLGIFPGLGNFK